MYKDLSFHDINKMRMYCTNIAALKAKGVDPFSSLLWKGKQIYIHEMRGWEIEKGSRSLKPHVLPYSAFGLDCDFVFCKNMRQICLVKIKPTHDILLMINKDNSKNRIALEVE